MNKTEYEKIDSYMQMHMDQTDPVHGKEHIYRVLKNALNIAEYCEEKVDRDVLITACLLHDIGRHEQNKSLGLDHAQTGSKMAYDYLISVGWNKEKASHVSAAIKSHTIRKEDSELTIEAKILFDADKIDALGFIGIARLLMYDGMKGKALYNLSETNEVCLEADMSESSTFIQEYNWKMAVVDTLYTSYAKEMAAVRAEKTIDFYNGLLEEITFYISDLDIGDDTFKLNLRDGNRILLSMD